MGVKLSRNKPRQLWQSVLYRFWNLPILPIKTKQYVFLNLEWLFDRLAHETSFKMYDEIEHPVRKFTRNYLKKKIKSDYKVLDLGCDEGVMTNYLADFGKKVVGIDYLADRIKIAKTKYNKPNLTFIHAEALDYLSKNDEKFDVLVLSHIIEHLDDPQKFLNDFKHFFKFIYIEVPDFEKYYLNFYRKDLDMKLIYMDADHITEFDRDEMNALLGEVGIKVIDSEFRYGVQKYWCEV